MRETEKCNKARQKAVGEEPRFPQGKSVGGTGRVAMFGEKAVQGRS